MLQYIAFLTQTINYFFFFFWNIEVIVHDKCQIWSLFLDDFSARFNFVYFQWNLYAWIATHFLSSILSFFPYAMLVSFVAIRLWLVFHMHSYIWILNSQNFVCGNESTASFLICSMKSNYFLINWKIYAIRLYRFT